VAAEAASAVDQEVDLHKVGVAPEVDVEAVDFTESQCITGRTVIITIITTGPYFFCHF
jgi:hypothetical protein